MSTTHVFKPETERAYAVEVVNVGLACCAMEFVAATELPDGALASGEPAAGDDVVSVLVVSGTITAKTSPAVIAAFEALPEPRGVVSFGSCANSGGPYWDSPVVVPGVDTLLPVDVYVPGCPPRPEALLDGLRLLDRLLSARDEAAS